MLSVCRREWQYCVWRCDGVLCRYWSWDNYAVVVTIRRIYGSIYYHYYHYHRAAASACISLCWQPALESSLHRSQSDRPHRVALSLRVPAADFLGAAKVVVIINFVVARVHKRSGRPGIGWSQGRLDGSVSSRQCEQLFRRYSSCPIVVFVAIRSHGGAIS